MIVDDEGIGAWLGCRIQGMGTAQDAYDIQILPVAGRHRDYSGMALHSNDNDNNNNNDDNNNDNNIL